MQGTTAGPRDQYEAVRDKLRAPFPKRVCVASNYSLSFFAGANAQWNIVDEDGSGIVVASVVFASGDPRHPDYTEYMAEVKNRAARVAAILNLGLQASEDGKRWPWKPEGVD
jgi:hypothetical protein